MSSMPAGHLVCQFWAFTNCGVWAGDGWRSWATHSCGTWSPQFVCLFVFLLRCSFWDLCVWCLMFFVPWCISPWPDLSAHTPGTLLGTWPPGWTSHKPAVRGLVRAGKPQPALPGGGGRLSHSCRCCWCVVTEGSPRVLWVSHLWPLLPPLPSSPCVRPAPLLKKWVRE